MSVDVSVDAAEYDATAGLGNQIPVNNIRAHLPADRDDEANVMFL